MYANCLKLMFFEHGISTAIFVEFGVSGCAGWKILSCLTGPGGVIFFPINAPGMGRFKLFDLLGYS